jgi:hypothetical protein
VTGVSPQDPPLADVDPLDSRLAEVQGARRPPPRWWLRHAPALGLSTTISPGLVLIPLGIALGPKGLDILSTSTLAVLDPVTSVTIAALGIFVGLGLDPRRPREGRLLAAASVEAALTIVLVTAGVFLADAFWLRAGSPPWLAAVVIGVCASASATAARSHDHQPSIVTRIGDLDDLLPILLGGMALASLREPSIAGAGLLGAAFVAITLAISAAGWLLVRQTTSESEQHVFVAGTVLLLGGAAAQLSQSALVAGLVAGIFWNLAGGDARERIGRDMRYVQHPLVVLLVLVAGARLNLSIEAWAFALVYVICRTAGKLGGGWCAGRLVADQPLRDVGISLLPPGVVGIAFALNTLQADAASSFALAVVILGSVASELLTLVVRAQEVE